MEATAEPRVNTLHGQLHDEQGCQGRSEVISMLTGCMADACPEMHAWQMHGLSCPEITLALRRAQGDTLSNQKWHPAKSEMTPCRIRNDTLQNQKRVEHALSCLPKRSLPFQVRHRAHMMISPSKSKGCWDGCTGLCLSYCACKNTGAVGGVRINAVTHGVPHLCEQQVV